MNITKTINSAISIEQLGFTKDQAQSKQSGKSSLNLAMAVTSPQATGSQGSIIINNKEKELTMPRSIKKNINLEHSNVEYVNENGDKASADFRHLDAKEAWLESQKDNAAEAASADKVVRVYRKSRLGERLLARFRGSMAHEDAEAFADQSNEVYGVRGFYEAIVK